MVDRSSDPTLMHPTEADIILFLEKRLPAEERVRVQAHLAGCPRCAETLAAVYRMPDVLAERADPPLLTASVRRQAERLVQQPPSSRVRRSLYPRPAFAGLVAVLLVSLALVVYLQRDGAEPDRFRTAEVNAPLATITPEHRQTLDATALEALSLTTQFPKPNQLDRI